MKKMRKILSFLLVFAMAFGCMSGMALAAAPTIAKETRPSDGVTEDQPFAAGTGGSQNFRIPCLVTLDDGTIVAACDARWNHASDACGLDTIVSRSTDGGKTWNYTFANYLGDNGNKFDYNSTAFIDPAIATNGEKIWMIADIYPAGVAINTVPGNMQARPGHTGFDANHNLALAKATDSVHALSTSDSRITAAFDYSLVKIDGAKDTDSSFYNIVDKDGNVVEGYEIDAFFNIKGEGVDTNLFIGDSPYFPWPTDFLYMTTSEDGGATWSIPTLIDVKKKDEQTLLVGPGRGITVQLPDGTERIIFTAYDFTYGDDRSCAIYSDDGGKTWTRGADVASWSSESVVTEADGKLYLFTRHGKAYYVSENYGESWGPQKSTGLSYNDNCQLTAITYSEKIDGKTAILFAAPSNTSSRSNGKIYVGLVQEDGSLDFAYEYAVNNGNYAYSCMDELSNGDIALLYESAGSAITYTTISMREVLGFEKNLVLDPEDVYVDEKEATEAAEITQEPNEKVATVASEFVVEEAVIRLRDYASSANASLSAFATENGVYSLEDCEFTFTKNGEKWQINNASSYLDISSANNYLGTATDLTVTKVDPDETVTGDEVFRICNADNRYAIFYTENMTFDAWATTNISSVKSTVKFDLVLLEKQDKVSPADVMPGYTRATEVKDGGVYLISYIWGADTEDKSDNGLIVLYPANGQTAQTKLVGTVATLAKNKVTITAVAPGTTTAVVGDVTYNITVNDPSLSPSYSGNDLPTEGMKLTTGTLETTEGSLEALFDGNPSTFYHSNWSSVRPTAADFWIVVELPEVTGVSGLRYLPRQNNQNGRILSYEISYSLDGENWSEPVSGKWVDDENWKLAKFDGNVEAKYVKLFATDSKADNSGRHMTGAELRIVGAVDAPIVDTVDKTALNEAIAAAEALNAEDYTEDSWKAVEENLVYAKNVAAADTISQAEVDLAAADLNAAIAALVEKEEPVDPPVVEEDEVVRLYGDSRYDTGYAVADALKEVLGVEKFEAVIVATGKNFADALAGSYLAVEKNAPILLTNGKDDNIAELHAYIEENVAEGGKVYILGGEAAVPAAVEAMEGYDVVRLFGDSRYDTNLAILAEAGVSGDSVIVATGKTFADSLSASAAKLPILLVKPNAALNDAQKEILTGRKNIYIVGGEGAVSAAYAEELAAYGEVTRVFGDSRYDTSVEIAKTFCTDAEKAVVASGKNFPDGLCGGPLAAALNAPLVLTKDGGAAAAAAYVADNAIASGFVLGGEGALADETVVEVFALESAEEIK